MKIRRILSSAVQLKRFPELLRCFRDFNNPVQVSLAFTTLRPVQYPYRLVYKKRHVLNITCWADLTTAWVVLLSKEYRIFPEDRIILDIGANIGVFAISANSLNSDASIYSIEPFPATYELLLENIEANRLGSKVHPRNLAISGESGEVPFDLSPTIPSHSRKIAIDPVNNSVSIRALTIGDFLAAEGIEEADFIKIDIEGAEYDVILKSPAEILRKSKRYGIEYHYRGVDAIAEHLQKAGFSISYEPKKGESGVVEFSRIPL